MFTATTAGRLYKGKTYGWTDNQERERTMYRGRFNYRDPRSGNFHWIDAVCFNDFGNNGGLVSFLEENFVGEDSGNDGDAVILVGYLRPTEKKQTIKVDFKSKGKKVTKEIPNVAYSTFEFVIEEAYYPPKSQGESSNRSGNASLEDDDEDMDFDDLDVEAHEEEDEDAPDVDDADEDGDDEDEEPEETPAQRKKRLKAEAAAAAKKKADAEAAAAKKKGAAGNKGGSSGSKPKTGGSKAGSKNNKPKSGDADDDFFDETA